MMYKFHFLISVLTSMCSHVRGYSSGAPPSACSTMMPQHRMFQPQNTPSPYQLRTTNYIPGQGFGVTLQSTGLNGFKGFIIAPKYQHTGESVTGRFTIQPQPQQQQQQGQTLNCGGGFMNTGGAITHTSNNQKYSFQFIWEPIGVTANPVVFRATVVEGFNTFWTNITSQTITVPQSNQQQQPFNQQQQPFNQQQQPFNQQQLPFNQQQLPFNPQQQQNFQFQRHNVW